MAGAFALSYFDTNFELPVRTDRKVPLIPCPRPRNRFANVKDYVTIASTDAQMLSLSVCFGMERSSESFFVVEVSAKVAR